MDGSEPTVPERPSPRETYMSHLVECRSLRDRIAYAILTGQGERYWDDAEQCQVELADQFSSGKFDAVLTDEPDLRNSPDWISFESFMENHQAMPYRAAAHFFKIKAVVNKRAWDRAHPLDAGHKDKHATMMRAIDKAKLEAHKSAAPTSMPSAGTSYKG